MIEDGMFLFDTEEEKKKIEIMEEIIEEYKTSDDKLYIKYISGNPYLYTCEYKKKQNERSIYDWKYIGRVEDDVFKRIHFKRLNKGRIEDFKTVIQQYKDKIYITKRTEKFFEEGIYNFQSAKFVIEKRSKDQKNLDRRYERLMKDFKRIKNNQEQALEKIRERANKKKRVS